MTSSGTYVRLGFVDGAAAAAGVERLGAAGKPLTSKLAATADPDAALEGLLRLVDSLDSASEGDGAAMLSAIADDEGTAMRLCTVLGASAALTHHLVRHPEHWREMVLTNVLGTAYTIRATLPALKETTGHILLTGSVAGRRAITGSLYSSTKWAVTGMGESLRQDVDGTGIRVTLVEPGQVDTPFFDNPGEGRLEADDIARAVMYAIAQPPHVDVNEILIRPTAQSG